MTRDEFLRAKRSEGRARYNENHRSFYTCPSVARTEPFKIADNLYYVGDKYVCVHMIDTGDGLILIDSGYLGAEHLLIDSIWRAGFDPADVRWIIHSHGHHDHFGASAEFKNMYGTKLAISRVDAEVLASTEDFEKIPREVNPYAEVPEFDRLIEDGEIFELGNVKIRCVLSPGHTVGVLSFFFEVTYEGKTYLAGMLGGAGTSALTTPYMYIADTGMDLPEKMLNTIDKIWDEPVDIHLGNHPSNNRTFDKRRKQLDEGGNPFIDPESWHNFLALLRETVYGVIKKNEDMEKEMNEICED